MLKAQVPLYKKLTGMGDDYKFTISFQSEEVFDWVMVEHKEPYLTGSPTSENETI